MRKFLFFLTIMFSFLAADVSHAQEGFSEKILQCWHGEVVSKKPVPVDIKIIMNPDATVYSATITDQVRYKEDEVFRGFAESALRAVKDPQCQPWNLPPDKYEEWKTITLTFDPSKML